MSYLSLNTISKKFGQTEACRDISIDITQGELFYLLGPSGCGKSTLLSIIAGLTDMDSGSIFLDGQDIGSLSPHKRPIHTIFQNYALFPHMTVAENVSFSLRMKKAPQSEISVALSTTLGTVGLQGFENRRSR